MKYREIIRHILEDIETPEVVNTDGVTLDTDRNFIITEPWVREELKLFNSKYFENKLDVDTLPIKINYYKNFLGCIGQCSEFFENSANIRIPKIRYLAISNYYKHSEYDYANILLHEMIHLYQLTVLYRVDYVNDKLEYHGDTFLEKRREINNFGWRIGVVETEEQFKNRGELNATIMKKLANLNNPNRYQLVFYIPKKAVMEKSADINMMFAVILSSEWGDDVFEVAEPFDEGEYLFFITTSIKSDGMFVNSLVEGNLFSKGNRISKQTLQSKATIKEKKKYISSRVKTLKYSMFRALYSLNEFKIASIKDYIETRELRESTKSKKLTLEEIKSMHEADPCVKVFKVEDHGDTYTIWGRVI